MAHKRMFSKDITTSDAFREMPPSSQNLYFHLGMEADDDGFVDSSRSLMRGVGASNDDLKILLVKRFLLERNNGIVVVKHWLINNTIRKDRYTPTKHIEAKKELYVKENNAYTERNDSGGLPLGNHLATTGIPSGTPEEDRKGKERIGKDRKGKKDIYTSDFKNFYDAYPKKVEKKKAFDIWKRKGLKEKSGEIIAFIEKAKGTKKWLDGFIPYPTRFLNGELWEDDLSSYGKSKEVLSFK
jgi:hypothetical protein